MTIERINPAGLGRPSGFSHAVRARGELVLLAGQTAPDETGIVAQFETALTRLLTALRAAGGHPEHLVSVTIYAVDLDDYRNRARELGEVWRRLAGSDYPAMAGIG